MKAKINYKSKKTIIIAIIVLALITVSALAVGLFLKGNNEAEAAGNNTIGNTVDNNANQPSNNVSGDTEKDATDAEDGENANTENDENTENQNAGNANTGNENAGNENAGNANQNNNQGNANIPNQEFVTERVEIIPERIVAENYWVSWGPTEFLTLINGAISLEKANIVAEKTVAKVTSSGLEQNPQSVKVGEILKYTITLTNTSQKVNGLVNVTDKIPKGTEFISATKTSLSTTPVQYENASEVTKISWKNVKVKAGSETELVVYVKVVAKVDGENITTVQNIATIYDGTTPEEEVPSPKTKVANITSNKTSKIIYNEQKPHEHIVSEDREPLHEQDIIEYTITLTNVGQASGTVKVSDTVPEGTTFINGEFVTVVDKNGKTTYQIEELVQGINVTVPEASNGAGIATVTFRVIVNSFEEETKTIRNNMAKVDGTSTNTTEDEAEKLYVDISVTKEWKNMENDAAQVYKLNAIKFQVKNGKSLIAETEVSANNEWKHTFEKLPKFDANGNEINYTVIESAINSEEQEILDTYYKIETKLNKDLASIAVTITNTFNPAKVQDDKTELTATKVWENMESEAAQAYAIERITIQVKLGNTVVQEKAVTEKENWTAEFTGLKKYDENGNLLVYTIDEVVAEAEKEKLAAYDKEIVGNTITNTFNPAKVQDDKTELTATKVWENMESEAAQAYAIENITIQVKLGNTVVQEKAVTEKENWTAEFTGLKKYDENGNLLVYTIDEVVAEADKEKLAAYDKEIVGNTITNTFNPAKVQDDKTELTATKIWNDNNDEYNLRPENITITIGGKEYSLNAENDENKDTSNEWTLTINDLPKYDANGNEIIYTLYEEKVDYYQEPVYSQDGLTVTNSINIDEVITEQPGTVTINVTSTTTATVPIPMDVVFVIDTSGSMQGSNATNMVNAVNNSIKTIMSKNSENRIGIVGFSGNKDQTITNSSTIIPLGKYATNTNYLTLDNNTIYSTVTSNYRAITGGTNTQAGIKAGAEMLTSQATTTFNMTVNGINVTGTRTPVLILVTDGEPTYYYADEAASGTRIGNGQTSRIDENYYYWTIRTAKYYKNAVTTQYYGTTGKQAKMFTIGIGIGTDNLTEDDYLAKALLNPNNANVNACNDGTAIETETDRWGNKYEIDNRSDKKKLYDLLNSAGTPYAYDYANGSKSGELTESDIESFLTSSLEGSSESMTVRSITTEETTNRRIDLTNIDTSKVFTLELISEETASYTFTEAQNAGYVKYDSSTSTYYIDLSDVERTVTVNVNYWEIERQAS